MNCTSNITVLCEGNFTNQTTDKQTVNLPTVILQILLTPMIIFGNGLILFAIKHSKSLKKVTYYFLGNLAVADLLFGLLMGARVWFLLTKTLTTIPCIIILTVVIICGGCSLTGVLLLCLQSFLSVRFVVKFRSGFTLKTTWSMIMGTWVFWTAFCSVGGITTDTSIDVPSDQCYLGNGYFSNVFLIVCSLILYVHVIVIIFLQIGTIYYTRKRMVQFQKQPCESQGTSNKKNLDLNWLKRLAHMSRIIGLVLAILLVCWVPFLTGMLILMMCPNCGVTGPIVMTLATLVIGSSLLNVVVYAAKSKEFRKAFYNLLCCVYCRKSQVGVDPNEPGASNSNQPGTSVQSTSQRRWRHAGRVTFVKPIEEK